jgi:hypothetical protein
VPGDREFELTAGRKPGLSERARQLIAATFDVRTRRAYRKLFCKPNSDELTDEGARVLADLAKAAGLGKAWLGARSEELYERAGRRNLLLHALARLDGVNFNRAAKRLTTLQDNKREETHDA